MVSSAGLGWSASAQTVSKRYTVDYRGMSISAAIERLVKKAEINIAFDRALIADKKSTCVAERLTASESLICILDGSGVSAESIRGGTFVLRPIDKKGASGH